MNRLITDNKLAKWLSYIVALVLVILPFHAFLTVWISSLAGHYTLLRLWKEFLLVLLMSGTAFLLIKDKKLSKKLWNFWPARLIGLYTILLLAWAFVPLAKHEVSAKAMWYGLLVNLRFLLFFLVVWLIAQKSNWLKNHWRPLLLGPAVLVAAVAILQFLVLPFDFLKHFGYGPSTIGPYETINHNLHHIRVLSTLRGANPLGAYLVLPLSALAVLIIGNKRRRLYGLMYGFGLLLALAFSFSRSAWIGTALSLAIVALVAVKSARAKQMLLAAAFGLVVILAAVAIAFHNSATFQNVFSHTEQGTKAATSSNEGHLTAFKNSAKDVIHQPWGRGVGTAGPESAYNKKPARIAENYYLQIAQEAGVVAAILFITICVLIGWQLWQGKADLLTLALFASLIGISFINLLSHAWTDDTLAYVWWGLAAIVLAKKPT